MKRPTRVTRGSPRVIRRAVGSAASVRIERNLKTSISSLLKPCRFWRKNTGPGLSSLMAMAVAIITGDSSASATSATSLSNSHLKTRFQSEIGRSARSNTGTPPT